MLREIVAILENPNQSQSPKPKTKVFQSFQLVNTAFNMANFLSILQEYQPTCFSTNLI